MGVIKTKISKVYAKASDRNSVHMYRKCVRSKPNLEKCMNGLSSGNTELIHTSKEKITLYSSQNVNVPHKTYNTIRLVLLHTIPKNFANMLKTDFCVRFEKAPHQLLKYHVIASGARADRTSQGMRRAFGTPFMKGYKPKSVYKSFPFVSIYLSKKYQNFVEI